MDENQLSRCREMVAKLANTDQAQAAKIIIAVVNEAIADKRLPQGLVDFLIRNAHIMLDRLLRFETELVIVGTDWRSTK
jgi:hypothetical protein